MAHDDLVLYLTLSPEFGGTRFGPFEGLEARLGSDKDRSHITLPEALGVAREHCKVIRQGGASMILSPSDRTAAVWLWKGDARRPVQVQTPTAVRAGDSFSLVTPEGPRFFIELGELPPEMKAARSPASRRGPKGLTAGKFAQAGKDLALARLFTIGPVAMANRAWYFVKSGAIWQPRILILIAMTGFGYLTAGASSCAAFKFKRDVGSAQKEADECKESLAYANSMGDSQENSEFHQLAGQILGLQAIGQALQKDTTLLDEVKAAAKKIVADPEKYGWLLEKSARVEEFSQWRERVDKTDSLDPATRKLLPFLAAVPKRIKGNWGFTVDSGQSQVCTRGPIRLTYRQGRNLGLSNVMLDYYYFGDASAVANDEGERNKLLAKTAEAAGETVPDPAPASAADMLRAGEHTCLRYDGDDDREAPAKVMSMLVEQIGKDAKYVPDADSSFGGISRIAKVFAADVPGQRFGIEAASANFAKGTISGAVGDIPNGEWVLKQTAEVIARSIILPCDAVLNGDRAKAEAIYGTLPSPISCLVVNYRLTHDG